MADPVVEDLIRAINREVVADTGGRSMAVGDELPELADFDEGPLRRLADNLDIPARLAPSPVAILERDSRQTDEEAAFAPTRDERPAIGAAVTYVVAASAFSMAPQERVPPAGDPEGRSRLEWAVAKDYAELAARRRIVPKLVQNGGRDDLGSIPLPDETGDAVAARALVLGIAARTSSNEDDILKRLVRAGRGRVASAAARTLLATNPTFTRLMVPEQQEVIVRIVAAEMERGFATDRPRPTIENAMAFTIVERAQAAEWGAAAVNLASKRATAEVEELREVLEAKEAAGRTPAAEQRPTPQEQGLPADRPANLPELMRRIQKAVAELTGAPESLWNGEIEPLQTPGLVRPSADGALLLDRDDAALPLFDLTQEGSLDPEQSRAIRKAIQEATETYLQWAVPEGHTPDSEAAAQRSSPRHGAVNVAVGVALAEIVQSEIIRRTLPPDLADQLPATEPPYRDPQFAPAARRFALVVDNVKGLETDPSETLRRMAGQDHQGAGRAVGELLVANSGIPAELRPAAVQMIGDTVVDGFDELAELNLADETEMARRSARHGRDLGNLVNAMVRVYENDPEFAQQDRAATERTAAEAIGLPVRQLDPPATTVTLDRPAERAATPRELMQRIQGAVGELTRAPESLWNDELGVRPPGGGFAPSAEGTMRVERLADLAAVQLTASADMPLVARLRDSSGALTEAELRASRDQIFDAARAYAQWAVPAGHTREAEAQAEADPRLDTIAESVRDAFAEAEFDEIADGVLPADLAEQVKAVGPPAHGAASAPAARGLAQSISEVTERGANPRDTLRHLAGQPRADIALAAAELLVESAEIPVEDQPAAVREAAERIDRAFEVLPARIEAWQEDGTAAADLAVNVREYGQTVGREAYALVSDREDNMFSVAADRTAAQDAQQDPSVRFVNDPAAANRSGTVRAPGETPEANRSGDAGQSSIRRGLDL
jgi:hypothetical protein